MTLESAKQAAVIIRQIEHLEALQRVVDMRIEHAEPTVDLTITINEHKGDSFPIGSLRDSVQVKDLLLWIKVKVDDYLISLHEELKNLI